MILTMMGILGTALRMALNKPRLGVVPPPSPRFPQSSKRLAPPFAALFSVRVRESITSYEIGNNWGNDVRNGRLDGVDTYFDCEWFVKRHDA